jgi:hypothetical protein
MTVAAGFVVENGIVMCVDSQETVGSFKYPVEKMMAQSITTEDCHLQIVIAGSGLGPLVDMAAQRIMRTLTDMHRAMTNYDTLEETIFDVLNELYEKYFKAYPADRDDKIIELLIGAKIGETEDPILFHTIATAISRVDDFAIIGSGRVGQSQIQHFYSKWNPLNRTALLAIYLLSISGSMLADVSTVQSGKSRVAAISRTGKKTEIAPIAEIRDVERLFTELTHEWKFMLNVADMEIDDKEFLRLQKEFSRYVRTLRSKFSKANVKWTALKEAGWL